MMMWAMSAIVFAVVVAQGSGADQDSPPPPRLLEGSCAPGDVGTDSGGGGCCFYNGCNNFECPGGYEAAEQPDDWCGFGWTHFEVWCCTGPLYKACAAGTDKETKMGCGRRAVGRSLRNCLKDCGEQDLPSVPTGSSGSSTSSGVSNMMLDFNIESPTGCDAGCGRWNVCEEGHYLQERQTAGGDTRWGCATCPPGQHAKISMTGATSVEQLGCENCPLGHYCIGGGKREKKCSSAVQRRDVRCHMGAHKSIGMH